MGEKETVNNLVTLHNRENNEFVHYLSTKEYADRYNKVDSQISIHCKNGRIKGSILVGSKWLIPEDAPYPMDKRKKS